ncbi:hypothetical protein [Amycolatopsis sp. PS_44_ISF1]|uniref:guanylate kinase n=1 Tax=Amycolatopsis sp. PS_44_ISF1 TaxID=2974917 RepID=UPI0028DF1A9A|nr:hypothetical protein [Amycolatopsis sp. PS_44_ISF1]MDT8912741.1 hypothetical protein [Amycolatopsis sp. PS_44_ISF1]
MNTDDLPLAVPSSPCLLVLSGPSGIGKTSLARAMAGADPKIRCALNVTTRSPRPGAEDQYEHVSRKKFLEMVENDEFIEWIHPSFDEYYGMPRETVTKAIESDVDLVFDWVPEGYLNLRRWYPEQTIGVFVMAPTVATMRQRLHGRATETESELVHRQHMAEQDFDFVDQHEYHVVNDDFDRTLGLLMSIRAAEKARLRRQPGVLENYRRIARRSQLAYYQQPAAVQ